MVTWTLIYYFVTTIFTNRFNSKFIFYSYSLVRKLSFKFLPSDAADEQNLFLFLFLLPCLSVWGSEKAFEDILWSINEIASFDLANPRIYSMCKFHYSYLRQFEDTFENICWRKVKQMQPRQLVTVYGILMASGIP